VGAVAAPAPGDYSRCPMRLGLAMVLLAVRLGIVGCGPEKPPPVVGEDDITAAHLRSLQDEPSLLRHLEPTEEEARELAKEEQSAASDTAAGSGDRSELEEEPTTENKVAGASIALLQVAVTIGAMVAPYFFF
jgi:hypothetical protein